MSFPLLCLVFSVSCLTALIDLNELACRMAGRQDQLEGFLGSVNSAHVSGLAPVSLPHCSRTRLCLVLGIWSLFFSLRTASLMCLGCSGGVSPHFSHTSRAETEEKKPHRSQSSVQRLLLYRLKLTMQLYMDGWSPLILYPHSRDISIHQVVHE